MEAILHKFDIAKIIYLICAVFPLGMFIVAKSMKKAEIGSFVIGMTPSIVVYTIMLQATVITMFLFFVLSFAYLFALFLLPIAGILVSWLLFYLVLFKNAKETTMAVSFSLGILQISSIFCLIAVSKSTDTFIRRLEESKVHSDSEFTILYYGIIIMAMIKIILAAASVFAVGGIYSSEKIPHKGKTVASSVIMALCSTAADAVLFEII